MYMSCPCANQESVFVCEDIAQIVLNITSALDGDEWWASPPGRYIPGRGEEDSEIPF